MTQMVEVLMTWVQFPAPTYWKERSNSHKFSSASYPSFFPLTHADDYQLSLSHKFSFVFHTIETNI